MAKKYFGTDGIRGKVGISPIVPDFILRLGYAAGIVLGLHGKANEHPRVLIGKDTRVSGYLLEAALESGFSAAGVDVFMWTNAYPWSSLPYQSLTFVRRRGDLSIP